MAGCQAMPYCEQFYGHDGPCGRKPRPPSSILDISEDARQAIATARAEGERAGFVRGVEAAAARVDGLVEVNRERIARTIRALLTSPAEGGRERG